MVGQVAKIPKGNGKPGCASLRLVHMLDDLGKMFFASMWTARPRQRVTHSFGFVADRRREEAQLIIQIACWRLHQIGYSSITI
eukprot:15914598-Heterocapsa_arctica.AAC.1